MSIATVADSSPLGSATYYNEQHRTLYTYVWLVMASNVMTFCHALYSIAIYIHHHMTSNTIIMDSNNHELTMNEECNFCFLAVKLVYNVKNYVMSVQL